MALAAPKDHAQVIVTYKHAPGKAAEKHVKDLGGSVTQHLKLIDGLGVDLPRGQLKKLQNDPNVASVEPDGKLELLASTGDLEYDNAWGVEHIGARRGPRRPATAARASRSPSSTPASTTSTTTPTTCRMSSTPSSSTSTRAATTSSTTTPTRWTTTATARTSPGILAAEQNGYLVVGVAPGVDLYALKILGAHGEGDVLRPDPALGWAVDHDIDVVNMSLGGHEVSAALQTAVANAYDAGVTLVAATGNVNPNNINELSTAVRSPTRRPTTRSSRSRSRTPTDKLTGFSCTGPRSTSRRRATRSSRRSRPGIVHVLQPERLRAPRAGRRWRRRMSPASSPSSCTPASPTPTAIGLLADDVKAHLCAQTSPAAGTATTDPKYAKWYGCGIVDADKALLDFPPPPPAPLLDAVDDTASVAEDTTTNVAVLANDTDPGGGADQRHVCDRPGPRLDDRQSRRHGRLQPRPRLHRRRHVRLHDHQSRGRDGDRDGQRHRHPGQRRTGGGAGHPGHLDRAGGLGRRAGERQPTSTATR